MTAVSGTTPMEPSRWVGPSKMVGAKASPVEMVLSVMILVMSSSDHQITTVRWPITRIIRSEPPKVGTFVRTSSIGAPCATAEQEG